MIVRRVVELVDEKSGQTPLVKKLLRYVFPDHWSFMLGEIAMYSFIVLVLTGIFITMFFDPSYKSVTYDGPYVPLQGREMTQAYKSVVDLSFNVRFGLVMRQTHHWAADVFIASIIAHLFRVFFTGAFRKPRQFTYYLGLPMLILAILEGYMGYSLIDDLLSGMGLAIGYAVVMSIPFVGGNLALWIWQGEYPGGTIAGASGSNFETRLFILHVFIVPILIALLLGAHLVSIMLTHHSQFRGGKRRQSNVVGTPLWPGYTLRSVGLMFVVVGTLFLLGGLVQINPIWLWGPYHTYLSMNGAQPDFYIGWLIGALRMMPSWEPTIAGYTVIPNPFWGGALFPLLVFAFLFLWPTIERRWITKDESFHHLLDRPRDAPWRTGIGAGVLFWVGMIFFAGSADRVFVQMDIPYETQIYVYDIASFIVPWFVGWAVYRWCLALKRSEAHPFRSWTGSVVRRTDSGGFATVSVSETARHAARLLEREAETETGD